MIKAFILAALISTTFNTDANAFERNISGVWKSSKSGEWLITQFGKKASFTQSTYDEEFGKQTWSFDGLILENGVLDSFSFQGRANDLFLQKSADLYCTMSMTMRAKGYVTGEFGGRIIHMNSCTIRIVIVCPGFEPGGGYVDCSGIWK